MGNTPQKHEDHDDKKNMNQGQRQGDGMKQTPQNKPDDKDAKRNPADDKSHPAGDKRDAHR